MGMYKLSFECVKSNGRRITIADSERPHYGHLETALSRVEESVKNLKAAEFVAKSFTITDENGEIVASEEFEETSP
jgi:hypothetical protein